VIETQNSDLPLRGDWLFPTDIRFGAGRVAEIGAICRKHGMARPLLVTDRGLAQLPIAQRVMDEMTEAGIHPTLFAEVQENPTDKNVVAGAEAYHAASADGVVALGGGSGLDCGKAVAALAGLGGSLSDLMWPNHEKTATRKGVPPIITIPTTAGTGAEVEIASVITDTTQRRKVGIWHPQMLSRTVIADPEMTLSLPRHLTAATAMDALIHNLEALCVPMYHPMADAMAIDGVARIGRWLPTVLDDPANIQGRANLLAASIAGATAFGKGLGAMHALSHAIGARIGGHHGLTNAILMPHVLDLNERAIRPALRAVASHLGLAGEPVASCRAWLANLAIRAEIPKSLQVIGVTPNHIPDLAEVALRDICATTNPVPLDLESLSTVLRAAID